MCTHFNPLILMSDQDRVSPYDINTIPSLSDEKKEKLNLTNSKFFAQTS